MTLDAEEAQATHRADQRILMETIAVAMGVPPEKILAARALDAGVAPPAPSKMERTAAWLLRDPYFYRKPEPPPNLQFLAGQGPPKRRMR